MPTSFARTGPTAQAVDDRTAGDSLLVERTDYELREAEEGSGRRVEQRQRSGDQGV
jgi:hypothetical protein